MKLNRSTSLLLVLFVSIASAGWCGDCWCAKRDGKCPDWRPKNYSMDFIETITDQEPLNPLKLNCNAYDDFGCTTMPPQPKNLGAGAVCAHHYSDKCDEYTIANYNSTEEAKAAGGVVTHFGMCGTCSTRQDLGVYMKYPDMTSVGKTCGIKTLYSINSARQCFEDLGMTPPCARIWADNAKYDSKNCLMVCLGQYFSAYNGKYPRCELNACLECDENGAGPIF